MGISILYSGCSCNQEAKPKNPNPNPCNFSICNNIEIGRYLIVKIKYPDCTNFEGMKILVFKDLNTKQLLSLGSIDPHFCDKNHCSPIARFIPTNEGWNYAIKFVATLEEKA